MAWRWWQWLITAAAIVGVVLNIRQHWGGFAIWIVTNAAWMVVDWRAGIRAQAVLQAVYLALSVWGLIAWLHQAGFWIG